MFQGGLSFGAIRPWVLALALLAAALPQADAAGPAPPEGGTLHGERYAPTIWIDPDGCEHWVFDDGAEGFMTPHLSRDGKPVCRAQNTCAVLNADQLFASGRATIPAGSRRRLAEFFRTAPAEYFIIAGYTDSRGPAAYNLRLSRQRAEAVAAIAAEAGAKVGAVRAYGEAFPRASNRSAEGRRQNRRVEIICMY